LFGQSNSKTGFVRYAMLTLSTLSWSLMLLAQKTPTSDPSTEKNIPLVGRVLAWKETFAFGAGVGPQYEVFVFGVESDRGVRLTPIKIAYAFFKSDGPLPDSFFDHSKQYELQAVRDFRCDESVEQLSYIKSVEHDSGKPLPPTYVLRFLEGVPKDVLKPNGVLACYVLRPGKYRALTQSKGGNPSTPTTR
jgi:hypothetical protein